ncbi:TRAP transporter large permease [Novipirellula artificiosorum]|uniref:Sialic acid TRAP transporter permease protein SiaT n=1 Tax=Novipirellula artificiosorum TaxID=2528016 RepID=A0A5C6DSM1_9BACT|nr:TRAP transporter large permease [Novipirellula artificiosorum]TWU39275.1 Sialic acid TRAP transporter permease protein SiaT [Novipirellula artificiosorum]
MTLLLLVLGMLGLMAVRVPVAHAMLLPCLLYTAISPDITMGVALQRMVAGINSFPLLAVPLFIMTGYLANAAGLSQRLFDLLARLLRHLPGRLAYVNVGCSVMFSWMSGAAIADAAGLGAVLVPAMRKEGYDEGFSLGLTGASSMIGPIMPPSIPAIIFAVTAGVSVGGLFFAGVIPALILATSLCLHVFLHVRRHPLAADRVEIANAESERIEASGTGRAVAAAIPVLLTPVIILGGILGGVFTPTEAAAAAVMYMMVLGGCYRSLSWKALSNVFLRTSATTGTILLIVASASLFGWIIAREQGPQMVAESLLAVTDNPIVFLLLVNAFLLLVGMLLEPTAALLICVPVLLPVAIQFGIDPLHLGIVMILNLVIGLITPPVGLVLYVLSSVTGSSMPVIMRGIAPFLVPLIATLLIVTFVPSISLWLPDWLGMN